MNFNITSYISIVVVIIASLNCLQVNCYSKVSKSGANYNQTDLPSNTRPKIHQTFNTDIIFPRVFNTTMDESFEVSTANVESTGRANKYTGPFQFSSLNPSVRRPSTYSEVKLRPSISYPVYRPQSPNRAEIDKLRGKGTAMDRYTPGEAVATSFYKQNNKNGGYMYKSPPKKETFPSQITSQDAYSPPPTKDLYAFPPNIDSSYAPPLSSSGGKLQSEVSSYLPAPAGPIDSYNGFVGPINPEYLPANFKISSVESDMGKKNPIKISESKQNMNGNMHESEDQTPAPPHLMEDHHQQVYSPQSDDDDNDDDSRGPMPMDEHDNIPDDDNDDDHHHHIPNHDHDLHSHHGPWDSLPSFLGGHSINTFPELIYDDHHHHHHHIPHPPEVLTTTTTERPEPRVKKYSYFYLGRKLWYIPLYFTVWFSFYILFLILKSIARHKVNLPNHYQRRMMKRDLVQDINHQETVERVNRLNASIMAQIEAFKEKYL